ncbi:HNH endonuclease signature motif containing protein [Herbaspirillum rhizosphaerae]|uniref:HNH endonuclease signature motif containing protein n=1 Tax=Herbaspirillum rhizosphaerae TaxID=346179 RepID=A0ABW8ZCV0_9BURK
MKSILTQDYLKSLLHYDPELGRFFRIVARGRMGAFGSMAGGLKKTGYRSILIDGKSYQEHRLVWLYVYGVMPEDQLDHINHCKDDNRVENLREASNQENNRNRSKSKNNISGITGVHWHESGSKWRACIKADGKSKHLGSFEHYFEAICARKSAELHYGFHENHGIREVSIRDNATSTRH